MRFFAALGVLATHVANTTGPADLAYVGKQRVLYLGWAAVSFFFVLSGFILTWSAKPGDGVVHFWRKRFARVYPAYLVALLLSVALSKWLEHNPFGTYRFWSVATLTQSWHSNLTVVFAVSPVAWSLSCEAFFYATWPLLVPRLARLSFRTRAWLLVGCCALTVAAGVYGSVVEPGWETLTLGEPWHWQGWFVYAFPPARLPEFLAGALLATLVRDGWRPRWSFWPALGLVAVGYAVAQWHLALFDVAALPLAGSLGLVLAGVLAATGGRARWLDGWLLLRLGAASYCLYLSHPLAIRLWQHWQPLPVGGMAWAYSAAMLVGAVLFAVVLHDVVERPAERWLRGSRQGARQ